MEQTAVRHVVLNQKQLICTCGDPDCMLVETEKKVHDHYVYEDKMIKGHLVVGKREPCFCPLGTNHWGDTT